VSLYEFITANKDHIISLTRAKITDRKWPAVSALELEYGLPLFLSQLAETLRLKSGPEPFPSSAIGTSAGMHGSEALAQGFSVAQVIHDYGDLCQGITSGAVEKNVSISSDDFQTLNLCLDNAIAGAVTEFSRQHEASMGEGEAERLGYLTHELRNHLSTAMLSFNAVRSGRVGAGGSTGAVLERNLMAMRDLLDTVISDVRLAAGARDTKKVTVAHLVHEIENAAGLQAAQREMKLTVAPIPSDVAEVKVRADRQLFSSAALNLLQNAFKYSVPHGHVEVRTLCENGLVSVEVEDECGGLPEGNAEAFFTSFGARRGRDRTGLGLGLNISRKAVRAMGGEISVRNLPGKGCIFTIELPVATA
jgi:signal transduction histidine kinase